MEAGAMKQFTPVIKMSIQRLACTACGAEANAEGGARCLKQNNSLKQINK
jgi:hypothetical protein